MIEMSGLYRKEKLWGREAKSPGLERFKLGNLVRRDEPQVLNLEASIRFGRLIQTPQ